MQLWRIHLKTAAKDGRDPFEFCLEKKIIGVGWPVSKKPNDRDEYWEIGSEEYKEGRKSWSTAINAIGWRMENGDLVWTRNSSGQYYLGKVSGEWEYRDHEENKNHDIVNVRPCALFMVDRSVPGTIVNRFARSATLQKIHDYTAEIFSIAAFNDVTGENLSLDLSHDFDIFRVFSSIDLEDVVGLYLQNKSGLLMVPSSRSKISNTVWCEYHLVHPKTGERAYVQVKSGDVKIDPSEYYESFAGDRKDKMRRKKTVYLFSPAGYSMPSKKEHVVCLARKDIEAFLNTERKWLPFAISTWLDLRDKLTAQK